MTNVRILCFALTAMLVCAFEKPVLAVTIHNEAVVSIRENNIDYDVLVQGTWYEYANDENCGNPAHRTSKGGRYFSHGHILYSFPVYAYEIETGNFMNVTAAKVKAYWDNQYDTDYISTGTADPSRNCWAFAFGYFDAWIQDPTYIYQDDYKRVTTLTAGFPVSLKTVIWELGHVIPIYGVSMDKPNYPNGFIMMTWEKSRNSGGYQRYYNASGANPFAGAIFFQQKP